MNILKKAGKYKIIKKLAEGGMGGVYLAEHPTLDRKVIVKKLKITGNKSIASRFKREAKIMLDFKHENIVSVYDHFMEGPFNFIVMEYIEGISIHDLIKERRKLSNPACFLIIYETLRALQYAHERGVVHRDIKPANILLSKNGEVKLTDFGIASYHEDDEELTRQGSALGTPAYMPPEQIKDTSSVDQRADIYSLGISLYEMITGKRPFKGTMTPESLLQIQNGKFTPVEKIEPHTHPLLKKIIKKALRKTPALRFKNAEVMIASLSKQVKCILHSNKVSGREGIKHLLKQFFRGDNFSGSDSRLFFFSLKKTFSGKLNHPKKQWIKHLAISIVGLSICATITYGYLHYWHRYLFQADQWGSFKVRFSKDKFYDPQNIRAKLFSLKDNKPSLVNQMKLNFKDVEGFSISQAIFIPPGDYQIRLQNGIYSYSRSFRLKSMRDQKKLGKNAVGTLSIQFQSPQATPIHLFQSAKDSSNQKTVYANFYIFDMNRWWLFKHYYVKHKHRLKSGKTYSFKWEHPHYLRHYQTIVVEPWNTMVSLKASLTPKTGVLSLQINERPKAISINGKQVILSLTKQPKVIDLKRLKTGEHQLMLAPGSYKIAYATKRGDEFKTSIQVKKNNVTALLIRSDASTHTVSLDQK